MNWKATSSVGRVACNLCGKIRLRSGGGWRTDHLRDSMRGDFVTVSIQILNLTVISPFVRYVKCGSDRATVRIQTTSFEKVAVQFFVQVVDCVVESEEDQLWRINRSQITWKTHVDCCCCCWRKWEIEKWTRWLLADLLWAYKRFVLNQIKSNGFVYLECLCHRSSNPEDGRRRHCI